MAFRGFFALNGVELINTSRVAAHIGSSVPTSDAELFGAPGDCSLTEVPGHPGVFAIPADSVEVDDHPGLWSPPNGSRLYSPGLFVIDDCWTASALCGQCRTDIAYDDTWPELREFLEDMVYRPELAPWYSSRRPESGEFGGVWVFDVKGLGPTPGQRPISELVGAGAAAGPYRDTSRPVRFEALLIACTNAGLEFGKQWLACQLRSTAERTDSVLRYLSAHPGHSGVDPADLVRELHGVVCTQTVQDAEQFNTGGVENQQATSARVSWELTALHPYAYLPQVDVPVVWDSVTTQPIEWVHAADCKKPASCEVLPVLFSADCVPEPVEVVTSPPPSCGGCLPVCAFDEYVFAVPTMDRPLQCHQTAVSVVIENLGVEPLTLQGWWRVCSTDVDCEDNRFPVQVSGLPAGVSLMLDGVRGRYWAVVDGRAHRPVGIVSTLTGSPWRPPLIDRDLCWEFVVLAADGADFKVGLSLADREA